MKRMCCAFTIHLSQFFLWGYNESDSRCVELKSLFADQIRFLVKRGYTDLLSGMTLGVDAWAAQTVLALRKGHPNIKLHCILPCIGQEKPWTDADKSLYFSIIKMADSRVYTSRAYYKDCITVVLHQCETGVPVYGGITDIEQLKQNLEENCIPEDFVEMGIEDYPHFLERRRVLMSQKIRRFYETLK